MRNKLLVTTAIVGLVFSGNVLAADDYVEYKNGDTISADDTGHTTGDTRISFVGENSTVTLDNNVTMGNYVTLDGKTAIVSGGGTTKELTVTGYLTETAPGSNLSGIDVKIEKGTVGGKEEGELVLGNDLTVGNVNMTDGTGIWLNTAAADHTSNIAEGKKVTFVDNNYISGKTDSSLTFAGNGGVVNEGALTLNQNVKVGSGVTFDNTGTVNNTKVLTNEGTFKNSGTLNNTGSFLGNILMSNGTLTGAGEVKGNLKAEGTKNTFDGVNITNETVEFDTTEADIKGGSNITSDSMSFKDTVLNFSGATNTLNSQNITFDGSEINVTEADALNIAGKNQIINVKNENSYNTADGVMIVNNATVNLDGGSLSINKEDKTTKANLEAKGNNTFNFSNGSKIEADEMSFDGTTLNSSGANKLYANVVNMKDTTVNHDGGLAIYDMDKTNGTALTFNLDGINTINGGFDTQGAIINNAATGELKTSTFGLKGTTDSDGVLVNAGKIVANLVLGGKTNISGAGTVEGNLTVSEAANVINGSDITGKTATFTKDSETTYTGINKLAMETINLQGATLNGVENLAVKVNALNLSGNNALNISGKDFTLNQGTINLLDGETTLTGGKLINHSTVNNSGNLISNVDFAAGSTYGFHVNKTNSGTDVQEGGVITGNVALTGDVNLKPTVAVGVKDGSYNFVDGTVTGSADNKWVGFNTNNLYNIGLNNDNDGLDISKKSSAQIAGSVGGNMNQGNVIGAVVEGTSQNLVFNNVANNISNLLQSSNPTDVAMGLQLVDEMSVDTTSSAQTTTSQNAVQVFSAVGSRLSGGSVTGSSQGKSSGDALEGVAMWAQGMYNSAKLDNHNGFDADTTGLALGIEKQITNSTKLGVGYAYSQTDIDSDSRKTDVDTHTAIVYGEYKPSNWFVNGIATYGWSSYDEKNAIKKADYDVDSFGLQAMTGYDFNTDIATFTPETGLRYVNIDQKAYTDNLGNHVAGGNSDILTGVAGIKVSKDFNINCGMVLKPEARFALTYDFANDGANSVVTLANGAAYTTNGEALDRFGMEFGAGLTADVNDNVELSLGYEGKFRDDYSDHTGLVNAKYKF